MATDLPHFWVHDGPFLFAGILTIDKGLKAVLAKTGIKVRPVFLPYPQAGVDVDKVEDMLLVESVLAGAAPLAQEQADSHDLIP